MSAVVRLMRFPHGEGLPTPTYQSAGAAGVDLQAALPDATTLVIEPGARDRVPTGLAIELPEGYEAQVRPRSGLALRHGVTVLNAPGTIDADYRGEVQVLLVNHGQEPFAIRRGDRIAQLVVAPVERIRFVDAPVLTPTERGAGGYGSTGTDGSPPPPSDR